MNTKQAKSTNDGTTVVTLAQFVTAAQFPDALSKDIMKEYDKEPDDKKWMQVAQLCIAGLTLKEAIKVHAMRNTKSESVSLRLTANEMSELDAISNYLKTQGLIADGRSEALCYMIKTYKLPDAKQLTIEA